VVRKTSKKGALTTKMLHPRVWLGRGSTLWRIALIKERSQVGHFLFQRSNTVFLQLVNSRRGDRESTHETDNPSKDENLYCSTLGIAGHAEQESDAGQKQCAHHERHAYPVQLAMVDKVHVGTRACMDNDVSNFTASTEER
jgi:hypothetical protein